MKPVLLSFGNCQALAMAAIALDLPAVIDRYEVHYLPCDPALGNISLEPGVLERCDIVWEQVGISQRLPDFNNLPASAHRLRYPELSFSLLWPFACIDPRNVPNPPIHWGQFPYGDRLALRLMKEGLYGEAGYAAWVERGAATLPDLQRLLELEVARAHRRSVDVDIEPMNFILANWRSQRLFATINHPSNEMLWSLCSGLITASLPSCCILDNEIAEAYQRFINPAPGHIDMDWFQMVVHPVVEETFGLEWCNESILHRFEIGGVKEKLTRRRYMADCYMVATTPPSKRAS